MAKGRFIIQVDRRGEHRFNLVASNGRVILRSEGYVREASCLDGIESVRRHVVDDGNFNRVINAKGRGHFNLRSVNGQVIGTSQVYADLRGMEKGIASVRRHAPDAVVLRA